MSEVIKQESENYQKAFRLHNEILSSGEIAWQAMQRIMINLKEMRDEELYKEMGFNSFEEYCENSLGIKKRQAYNYISTYEKLYPTGLLNTKIAQIGITKLSILSDVPATKLDTFLENNDVTEMSARELKQATEKIKEMGEQISLYQQKQQDFESTEVQLNALKKELQELKNKPIEVAVAEPSKEDIQKIKEEIKKEILQKANADKKIELTRQETTLKATFEEEMRKSILEKNTAEEKIKELEKKTGAGSSEKEIFKIYFEELQTDITKAIGFINTIKEDNVKAAFKSAMLKYIEMMADELGS